LESENTDVQIHAIRAIGKLGESNTADVLLPLLSAENDRVRKEAFLAFVSYTDPSNYSAMYEFVWDSDEKIRRIAMVSIERFVNSRDREILEEAAQHEDKFVRERAQALLDEL
jgi:HEAT repeat protein